MCIDYRPQHEQRKSWIVKFPQIMLLVYTIRDKLAENLINNKLNSKPLLKLNLFHFPAHANFPVNCHLASTSARLAVHIYRHCCPRLGYIFMHVCVCHRLGMLPGVTARNLHLVSTLPSSSCSSSFSFSSFSSFGIRCLNTFTRSDASFKSPPPPT